MITRETLIDIKNYQIRFTVFDDKDWFVAINDNEEEFSVSSSECFMNWHKGLAEAFVNFASMVNDDNAENLMFELIMDERIHNEFRKYLPAPYNSTCYGCPYNKDCNLSPGTCND